MQTRTSAVGATGLATAAAMALALGLALDAPAVRMTAALVACLVLPGLGWARRLRLRDLGDTIAMTVVLSLSLTAVVATGMAVTATWSPLAGLAILAVITVAGFVPTRVVLRRAAIIVFGHAEHTDREELALPTVEVDDTEDGWIDWYADARARSDEERRRRVAEAEAAEQDWRDWYAESHRATDQERSQQWGADQSEPADRASADGAGDGAADPSEPPVDDWSAWTDLGSSDEVDSTTDQRVKL